MQQGASIILVPSYTTTLSGYYRVFLSCRARAIENQCYVAVSYVMNKAMLVVGDVSLQAIEQVRKEGQVHNFEDIKRCTLLENNNIIRINMN